MLHSVSVRSYERLRGTASRETIRRMLNGASVLTSVPHWDNVELVYRALCDFAGRDPEATYEWNHGYDSETVRFLDELREAWSRARKAPAIEPQKPQTGGWGVPADPWRGGEPPF